MKTYTMGAAGLSLTSALGIAVALFTYTLMWPNIPAMLADLDILQIPFQDFQSCYMPMVRELETAQHPVLCYYYPSAFAVVLLPLKSLSVDNAFLAWGMVQALTLLGFMVLASQNLLEIGARPIHLLALNALVLLGFPTLHNLAWGQVSLLLLTLLLASQRAHARDHKKLAAAMLALAVAFKIYPFIFAAYFLFRRDLRTAALTFCGTLLLIAGLPAAALGPSHWLKLEFWITAAREESFGGSVANLNSQYPPHVLARYLEFPLTTPIAVLFTMALFGLILFRTWRKTNAQMTTTPEWLLLELSLLLCTIPLVLRTAWPHYFVHLPLVQVFLWILWSRHEGLKPLAAQAAIGATAIVSLFPFSRFMVGNWLTYTSQGWLCLANLGMIAIILLSFSLSNAPSNTPNAPVNGAL